MELESILDLLEGVEATGGGNYKACCPAHDDKNPSLGIKEDKDTGTIVLNCLAGCTFDAIIKALKLDSKDLFINNSSFNKKNPAAIGAAAGNFRPLKDITKEDEARAVKELRYIKLKGKHPIHAIKPEKGGRTFTLAEVKNCQNVAVLLDSPYIVLDIDTHGDEGTQQQHKEEANLEALKRVLEAQKINTVHYPTLHGYHIWLKTSKNQQNHINHIKAGAGSILACGIVADALHGSGVDDVHYTRIKVQGQWLIEPDRLISDNIGDLPACLLPIDINKELKYNILNTYNKTNVIMELVSAMKAAGLPREKCTEVAHVIDDNIFLKGLEATNIDWSKIHMKKEEKEAPEPFKIISYTKEEAENIKELEYIYKINNHILPRGVVGMISSRGGLGKSFFIQNLVTQLTLQDKNLFLNMNVIEPDVKVLYMSLEDVETVVLNRFKDIKNNLKLTEEQRTKIFNNIDFIYDCGRLENDGGKAIKKKIIEAIEKNKYKLIVIDTLSRFCPLEAETSNIDATKFIQELEDIAHTTNCTILLIHHTNKESITSGAVLAVSRGSSALTDGVRNLLVLKDVYKEEGTTQKQRTATEKYKEVLKINNLTSIFTVHTSKSNYSPGFSAGMVITTNFKMEEVSAAYMAVISDMIYRKDTSIHKIPDKIKYDHKTLGAHGGFTPAENIGNQKIMTEF